CVSIVASLPRIPHHAIEKSDQLFLRAEKELDPTSAPFSDDPDLRLKAAGELFLGVPRERVPALLSLDAIAGGHPRRSLLGLPDRECTAHDLLREQLLIVGRREGEQSLCVAGRELSAADPVPNRRR